MRRLTATHHCFRVWDLASESEQQTLLDFVQAPPNAGDMEKHVGAPFVLICKVPWCCNRFCLDLSDYNDTKSSLEQMHLHKV